MPLRKSFLLQPGIGPSLPSPVNTKPVKHRTSTDPTMTLLQMVTDDADCVAMTFPRQPPWQLTSESTIERAAPPATLIDPVTSVPTSESAAPGATLTGPSMLELMRQVVPLET